MALHHKNIHIKNSKVHGDGLFAKRNIKKGETIALIRGKIIKWIVVNKKTSSAGPNWIGLNKHKWINPLNVFDKINHSCDPNAGIKGSVTVVALHNIMKDEEITIDYSITEEDLLWTLDKKCRCGSPKCRKVIRSIQFLPPSIYKSYLPYIPRYFQNIYKKYHKLK